jgi:hypothetical protein
MPDTQAAPPVGGANKWALVRGRVEDRLITAIDLLSILILDAVILAAGFLMIAQTGHLNPDDLPHDAIAFFETARRLSAGLFLLLYVVFVSFHIYRFFTTELKSGLR